MTSGAQPVPATDAATMQLPPSSTQTPPHAPPSPSPFSLEEYLEAKNRQFVWDLAPTLSYLALLLLAGLLGNTLVLLVYYRRFKPSVTRTYVLAMSVCDLATNLLSLPADIVEVRLHNTFSNGGLCKSFRTVKSLLGFLSAFILVAVAFDRQRAICGPQTNPPTVRHALTVLGGVGALAVAFTLPYSVLTGPSTLRYPDSNVTGLECSVQDLYAKSLFLFVYNVVTGLVLIVCITLMLASYVRIARQLWQHKKHTAVIMGTERRKASTWSSHTSSCDDSSSSRTHSSSAGSRRSDKATEDRPRADMELSHTLPPLPEDGREGPCAELPHPEDPNGTSSSTSKDPADNLSSEKMNTDMKATDKLVTNMNSVDSGYEDTSTAVSDTSFSNVTVHKKGRQDSESKQPGRVPSRARALWSHLRHTARDAFAPRKKSAAKRRGSVKKIPTRTTLMMFVLTVIFIVNYLPYLLLVSVRSRTGMEPLVEGLGLNGYHIGLRSYFINSAVNSLVYSFCSARFRQECRRLLKCKN